MHSDSLVSPRTYFLLGHLYFLLFIGLAVVLFRERVFVADSAFQVFHILKTGEFSIQSNRFSMGIAQALPVAAVYLKLPLNTVLVLYSVSAPLFCYGCYILVAHWLKDPRAAIAMALASGIVLTQSFYFATFEIQQAVCVLVLLAGLLLRTEKLGIGGWMALFSAVSIALFFHPLATIGFLFLCGFALLQPGNLNKRHLWLILFIGLVVVLLKMKFLVSPYEQGKMPTLRSFFPLNKYYYLAITPVFMKWLLQDYYVLLLLALLLTVTYVKQKNWLLLGWFWLCSFGYLLLVLNTQSNADPAFRHYLELQYQVFGLFAAVPFAYNVLPGLGRYHVFLVVLAGVLLSRILVFYASRIPFVERLQWYDHLYAYTDQFPETRFLINEQNAAVQVSKLELFWASAHESLLYFASTHRQPQKIIFVTGDATSFEPKKNETGNFFTPFGTFPDAELPQHYFQLPASKYRFLNSEPDSVNPQPNQVLVKPLVRQMQATPGQIIHLPVRIETDKMLPSGLYLPNSINLGFRLYRHRLLLSENTLLTPLETDVEKTYEQVILVEAPPEPGNYILVPDLVPHAVNRWNSETEVKLEVR